MNFKKSKKPKKLKISKKNEKHLELGDTIKFHEPTKLSFENVGPGALEKLDRKI